MEICEICGYEFVTENTEQKEDHVNNCLDNVEELQTFQEPHNPFLNKNEALIQKDGELFRFCFVCQKSLLESSQNQRINHIQNCANNFPGINKKALEEFLGNRPIINTKEIFNKKQIKIEEFNANLSFLENFHKKIEDEISAVKLSDKEIVEKLNQIFGNLVFDENFFEQIGKKDRFYLKLFLEKLQSFEDRLTILREKQLWIKNILKRFFEEKTFTPAKEKKEQFEKKKEIKEEKTIKVIDSLKKLWNLL